MHIKGINPAILLPGYYGYVTVGQVDGLAFFLQIIGKLACFGPCVLSLIDNGKCIHKALYCCYFTVRLGALDELSLAIGADDHEEATLVPGRASSQLPADPWPTGGAGEGGAK